MKTLIIISAFILAGQSTISAQYAAPVSATEDKVSIEPWMLCPDSFMRPTVEAALLLEPWMQNASELNLSEAAEEPIQFEEWMISVPGTAWLDTTLRVQNRLPQS